MMYYLFGYATISVEGYFIERFINICRGKQIFLWNMKRKKSSFLFTNIAIKDFKKIRQVAKVTKCQVKIQKKKGLPFLLHRYQKRKLFIGLLLTLFLVIFGVSNFVWNIEIIGNNTIPTEELLEQLNEYGLVLGKLKNSVKTKEIISKMIVEVVEADKKPDIIDENEYCSIVSKKEGRITKINVQNGTALVKVGDIVTKR